MNMNKATFIWTEYVQNSYKSRALGKDPKEEILERKTTKTIYIS
jgi:hypothetical protein